MRRTTGSPAQLSEFSNQFIALHTPGTLLISRAKADCGGCVRDAGLLRVDACDDRRSVASCGRELAIPIRRGNAPSIRKSLPVIKAPSSPMSSAPTLPTSSGVPARPAFARAPESGQVSVWDFPRPPRLSPESREIIVRWGSHEVARTSRAFKVLETAHLPSFYLPWNDVNTQLFRPAHGNRISTLRLCNAGRFRVASSVVTAAARRDFRVTTIQTH